MTIKIDGIPKGVLIAVVIPCALILILLMSIYSAIGAGIFAYEFFKKS